MSSYLTKILQKSPIWSDFQKALVSKHVIGASGISQPLCAAIGDAIASEMSSHVILVVPEDLFLAVSSDSQTASGNRSLQFPAWNILPYAHKYPDAEIVSTRINSLRRFTQDEKVVLVTTPSALMWRTLPADFLGEHSLKLLCGMEIKPEELARALVNAGYVREKFVEFLGTFARRGEIIDFFSPAHENPVRIEFLEDVIEEMRFFSTRDQRSIGKTKEALVLPAVEWLTMEEPTTDELISRLTGSARDILPAEQLEELAARIALDRHFPGAIWFAPLFEPPLVPPLEIIMKKKPIVVAFEPERLLDEAREFFKNAQELYGRTTWEQFAPLPPEILFPDLNSFENIISNPASKLVQIREIPCSADDIDFASQTFIASSLKAEVLFQFEKYIDGNDVFVSISSDAQSERIERHIGAKLPVPTRHGSVSQSFFLPSAKTAVFSGDQILGFSRSSFIPQKYHQGKIALVHYGLEQGDFVVHSEYGIAKFMGISLLKIDDYMKEFLLLQFAENENLYVPMEDFYLVNPYLGPSAMAKLSKLGGKKWAIAKARASDKIFELAGELVRIYAMRQVKTRPPIVQSLEWENELRKTFQYNETADQIAAIDDIMSDLESEHPMDRLLCGDVGFGKTEVALRAAVRVVSQGYQVAVLVPTTILAEQHFETFTSRIGNLPVNVRMLSRFTPKKNREKIIQDLASGKVDIIIGTHMLLGEQISFNNLGLVIIDEEQWFGVKHKERLKSLRAEVDVLTMTATPIPRTMYFSVSGVRDLSIIETPPEARRPIFTQIVPWNIDLFRKAIYQELERGGQVFFVHNRVETIYGIHALLKKEMPDVRIIVAHGQMSERSLEKAILDFRAGKYDMLLSTTIIESGTDMPKVNTIIINRADKFGLAQLYQLRGRVGRADVQAYAYLVVPPYRSMTADARKRLRAILGHTELGAGYHLALKDMEIRGAGNLLGKEQSGFIEEIGLDLYTKMLAEAVAELKGQKPPIFEPIPFSINFDAYLPADYISDTEQRISAYQRLFTAEREDRIRAIADEIADRFGHMPDEAQNLVKLLQARILATRIGFKSMFFSKTWISLTFPIDKLPLSFLSERLSKFSPPLSYSLEPIPSLKLPRSQQTQTDLDNLIRMLRMLG